eukprot:3099568-Amphidinium_carterae.1
MGGLDAIATQYLDHLYLERVPLAYGGHFLSALRRFLPTRRYTETTGLYFRNWSISTTSVRCRAIPLWLGRFFKGFTPYSLHGGVATWHFVKYGSLSATQLRVAGKRNARERFMSSQPWPSWQL